MNDVDILIMNDYVGCIAEAVDVFVNYYKHDIDDFYHYLFTSGMNRKLESLDPSIVGYRNGVTIASEILHLDDKIDNSFYANNDVPSKEFWAGKMMARFQFTSKIPYYLLAEYLKLSEVVSLYHSHQSCTDEYMTEVLRNTLHKNQKITNLQKARKMTGLSQRELAIKAGINYRTLQQYESGAKDINKASVSTVLALKRALHCPIEDLLEY